MAAMCSCHILVLQLKWLAIVAMYSFACLTTDYKDAVTIEIL